MIPLDGLNPRFAAWYGEQSAETQAAIDQAWADTEAHPELGDAGGSSGIYFRRHTLLSLCADRYGYDFT